MNMRFGCSFNRGAAAGASGGVGQDKIHDRRRIFQTVRVMANVRFVNDLDFSAQLAVTRFHQGGVFRRGDHVIGVTDHMNERDPGFGQRFQRVHGITPVGQRLGFIFETIAA